jgi:hypothetical protein
MSRTSILSFTTAVILGATCLIPCGAMAGGRFVHAAAAGQSFHAGGAGHAARFGGRSESHLSACSNSGARKQRSCAGHHRLAGPVVDQ